MPSAIPVVELGRIRVTILLFPMETALLGSNIPFARRPLPLALVERE